MTDSKTRVIKLATVLMFVILTCSSAQAQNTDLKSPAEQKDEVTAASTNVSEQNRLAAPTNLSEAFKVNWARTRNVNSSRSATAKAGNAPQPAGSDEWEFQVTPYLFMSAIDGTLGVGGRTAEVDVSFADVFRNLNFGFMGTLEAKKGKWLIPTDMMYVNMGDDRGTPGPLFSAVNTDSKMFMLEPKVGYRLVENDSGTFDVMGGFRYWHLRTTLDFSAGILPAVRVSESQNWVDPIAGARGTANLSPKVFLFGKGDVGFGAQSDFTWQVLGGGGYRLNEKYALLLGYRLLSVDYRNNGFIFDVNMHGVITGLNIRFK